MRLLRRMLVVATGCLVAAFALAAGSTAAVRPAAVQTSSYVWAQPWSAATAVPSSEQLPASVGTLVATRYVPPASYPWVQPWGAAVAGTSVQPPGGIPTGD